MERIQTTSPRNWFFKNIFVESSVHISSNVPANTTFPRNWETTNTELSHDTLEVPVLWRKPKYTKPSKEGISVITFIVIKKKKKDGIICVSERRGECHTIKTNTVALPRPVTVRHNFTLNTEINCSSCFHAWDIWALAKWERDQHRNGNLGMTGPEHDCSRQTTLDILFKYSAHRTPTSNWPATSKGNSDLVILVLEHEGEIATCSRADWEKKLLRCTHSERRCPRSSAAPCNWPTSEIIQDF